MRVFLEQYGNAYDRNYRSIDFIAEIKKAGFRNVEIQSFNWIRKMTWGQFEGMSLSSTKMNEVVKRNGKEETLIRLNNLLNRYVDADGILDVVYKIELFFALK